MLWVVDDQGWANIGYNNPGNVHTPVADALAADGVVLERQYAYPWCAPSRASLMTGRLPYHVSQTTGLVARGYTFLPAKLKELGYACVGLDGLGETDMDAAVAALPGRPLALAMGAEGPGLRDKTRGLCDSVARIPSAAEFASLNVSNAAAVALYAARAARR